MIFLFDLFCSLVSFLSEICQMTWKRKNLLRLSCLMAALPIHCSVSCHFSLPDSSPFLHPSSLLLVSKCEGSRFYSDAICWAGYCCDWCRESDASHDPVRFSRSFFHFILLSFLIMLPFSFSFFLWLLVSCHFGRSSAFSLIIVSFLHFFFLDLHLRSPRLVLLPFLLHSSSSLFWFLFCTVSAVPPHSFRSLAFFATPNGISYRSPLLLQFDFLVWDLSLRSILLLSSGGSFWALGSFFFGSLVCFRASSFAFCSSFLFFSLCFRFIPAAACRSQRAHHLFFLLKSFWNYKEREKGTKSAVEAAKRSRAVLSFCLVSCLPLSSSVC